MQKWQAFIDGNIKKDAHAAGYPAYYDVQSKQTVVTVEAVDATTVRMIINERFNKRAAYVRRLNQ